jgi:hypothetical protein
LLKGFQQRSPQNLAAEKPATANRRELAPLLLSATPLNTALQLFAPGDVVALDRFTAVAAIHDMINGALMGDPFVTPLRFSLGGAAGFSRPAPGEGPRFRYHFIGRVACE